MEINPYVLKLMGEFATSEQQLQEWIDYHHRVDLEDVLADQEREELDELQDLTGWDPL